MNKGKKMSIFEEGENGLITTPADKIGKKLIFLTNTSKEMVSKSLVCEIMGTAVRL